MGVNLPPEAKEGQVLSAAWLNALRSCVAEALTRAGVRISGLSGSQGVHGTTLAGDALEAAGGKLWGKSPTGGIGIGDTETVTLYQHGSASTLGTRSVRVFNPGPDFCPEHVRIWIGEWNGIPNTALWWSCEEMP